MSSLATGQNRLTKTVGTFLAALATVAIYLPMWVYLLYWLRVSSDYWAHLREAANLANGGAIATPHMLFHALTAGISHLSTLNIVPSALVLLTLCVALTAVVLYRGWTAGFPLPFGLKLLLVPLILIAAPVSALYWVDGHLYFGYIGLNVFHNPTILVLKPFALAVFWLAACFWRSADEPRSPWLWWAMPLLLILSALAKPSFLIVFLPGLTLFLLWRQLNGKFVDWPFYLLGVVVPSVLVLGWQFWVTYSAEQVPGFAAGKSGIVLAPFTLMKLYSDWLLPKLLLSLAFPLTVTVTMWHSARRDPQLLLGWAIFVVGAVQTYFLMESGPRATDGNFVWSGQIGLWILFVASISHFFTVQQDGGERAPTPSWLLCMGVLFLHVLSGIALYAGEFFTPQRYW